MATSEELFISIPPQAYRESKSSGLMSQVELLHSLKHLQNLKVLSRRKSDLKKKFHKLLSSALSQINSLQNKMPTPKIPKTAKRYIKPKLTEIVKRKSKPSRQDEIEEELKLIQDKLLELNS